MKKVFLQIENQNLGNLPEELMDLAADNLTEHGICVVDSFISADEIQSFNKKIAILKEKSALKKAGIGKQNKHTIESSIRGDYIHWLEKDEMSQLTSEYYHAISTILKELNQRLFLGLKDMEFHYTEYPKGAFYRKHVDRFERNAHRVLSFVLYLNMDWKHHHGGELVIYSDEDEPLQIAPLGGRLAIFKSELLHEVLTTSVERRSITGWMLDQEAGLTFL